MRRGVWFTVEVAASNVFNEELPHRSSWRAFPVALFMTIMLLLSLLLCGCDGEKSTNNQTDNLESYVNNIDLAGANNVNAMLQGTVEAIQKETNRSYVKVRATVFSVRGPGGNSNPVKPGTELVFEIAKGQEEPKEGQNVSASVIALRTTGGYKLFASQVRAQ